jgi:lysophospholipase L1-like esterase
MATPAKPTTAKFVPPWVYLSLVTNGVLFLTAGLLLFQHVQSTQLIEGPAPLPISPTVSPSPTGSPTVGSSLAPVPRQQLNYQQWVDVLAKEARVAIAKKTDNLTILAGDSLSLWFPTELLPTDYTWLNQSISGETSNGLQKRLNLFESAQPKRIFVMIGINDLQRGSGDQELLDNYWQIIINLQQTHPTAMIVVQSILPHAGDRTTTESREQLLAVPNERIYKLNQKLAAIAQEAGVNFLDLYPLFTDHEGFLRAELTTDGLHLSPQGYLVWRSALQVFSQLKPDPIAKAASEPAAKSTPATKPEETKLGPDKKKTE